MLRLAFDVVDECVMMRWFVVSYLGWHATVSYERALFFVMAV